eukprot:m.73861 g.73861  ORF g.73861 m.73861 type:complete len:446 (+) comp16134_c0_seq1:259-1596(+)
MLPRRMKLFTAWQFWWQYLAVHTCAYQLADLEMRKLPLVAAHFMIPSCMVTDFGAIGDNYTDNTDSFRAAAKNCGVMVIPRGTFVSGAFNLSSHQRLEILAGATVVAVQYEYASSAYLHAYPLSPGVPPFGHHPGNIDSFRTRPNALICARHATNITIVGAGNGPYSAIASVIDGLGWLRPQNSTLFTLYSLVEFYNCTDVQVSGVTIANSPTWSFHPFDCDRVHIGNVSVIGPRYLGGVSGIHPDSSRNVLVEDSFVDVGDDGIVIASYQDFFGIPRPSANITVRRCTVLSRNIAIGAGTAGGISNITFEDCEIGNDIGSSPWAFKIKSQTNAPALLENITVRRLRLGRIQPNDWQQPKPEPAIDIRLTYGENITATPILRNVVIEDVYCDYAAVAGSILGLASSPIQYLKMSNITFANVYELHSRFNWMSSPSSMAALAVCQL